MAEVKPFKCHRPQAMLASEVAALPYDVFSRAEAAAEIAKNPRSFLRIDRPWAVMPEGVEEYCTQVYRKAAELFSADLQAGVFIEEKEEHYFIYRLTKDEHVQTGIVSCIAVSDFDSGVLKQHENTRSKKLEDRVCHIKSLRAHTGPIFVAYKSQKTLEEVTKQVTETEEPLYDFRANDGVCHTIWRVNDKDTEKSISRGFAELESLYIVDGHHRASAAARVGKKEGGKASHFLMIAFPSHQLKILDYNRVVADTNGLSKSELLEMIATSFLIERAGVNPVRPVRKGEYTMYLDGEWYRLSIIENLCPNDPVCGLDVSLLHDLLLKPILGIDNPRTCERINYVGGARGLEELKSLADTHRGGSKPLGGVSFVLYPCSLDELFVVADMGQLMPPKSTWFEPKPRSGLFIHRF